jgi:hypothetical protein
MLYQNNDIYSITAPINVHFYTVRKYNAQDSNNYTSFHYSIQRLTEKGRGLQKTHSGSTETQSSWTHL